jgi:hypothetical protein
MRGIAFHQRPLPLKFVYEKSSPHATILSQLMNNEICLREKGLKMCSATATQLQRATAAARDSCSARQPRQDYPKISFTFSKIDEFRSAGLFSTFNDAPNCSINFRCSRVNFVGVITRT